MVVVHEMKSALRVNLVWSILMLAAFAYLAFGQLSNWRGGMLLAAAAYVAVSVLALRGNRWAVGFTVVVATLMMVRWLPMVAVNFWMFFSGHDLYQDSPATIFIVAVNALVFAIPSVTVCALFFSRRRQLWFTLSNPASEADA